MTKISPSTNPISENELVNYALELQSLGADYLHCDVMDGVFVEAKCLNAEKIKEINLNSLIQLDVHLMMVTPIKQLKSYIKARPNIITLHLESFKKPETLLECLVKIKKAKILCGLSIKPNTPLELIYPYLPMLDLVLIMSVEPGQSGQKFIESTLNRIKTLSNHITKNNFNIIIEVDGGINKDNVKQVVESGANMVVMGSAMANCKNRKELIDYVRSL